MNHHLLYFIFFCFWMVVFRNTAIIFDDKFATIPSCKEYVINTTETYNSLIQETVLKCAALCSRDENCSSFNYLKTSSECRLNRQVINSDCSNGYLQPFSLYFEKAGQGCLNGGTRVTGECVCNNSYIGERCERLMYDCLDGMSQYEGTDGIYRVRPIGAQHFFEVNCLMKWGGRTIVGSHVNSDLHFNKTWQEAVDGYGDVNTHYWIGMRKLSLLTKYSNRTFCLQIRESLTLEYVSNCYKNFQIDDEAGQFKILNSQNWYNNIPQCLLNVVGITFSAYDNDNDNATRRNCASEYGAHWWFGENCSLCNPLGSFTNPKGLPWTGEVHIFHWVGMSTTPRALSIWLQ